MFENDSFKFCFRNRGTVSGYLYPDNRAVYSGAFCRVLDYLVSHYLSDRSLSEAEDSDVKTSFKKMDCFNFSNSELSIGAVFYFLDNKQ